MTQQHMSVSEILGDQFRAVTQPRVMKILNCKGPGCTGLRMNLQTHEIHKEWC
jgi:hypothetical protein